MAKEELETLKNALLDEKQKVDEMKQKYPLLSKLSGDRDQDALLYNEFLMKIDDVKTKRNELLAIKENLKKLNSDEIKSEYPKIRDNIKKLEQDFIEKSEEIKKMKPAMDFYKQEASIYLEYSSYMLFIKDIEKSIEKETEESIEEEREANKKTSSQEINNLEESGLSVFCYDEKQKRHLGVNPCEKIMPYLTTEWVNKFEEKYKLRASNEGDVVRFYKSDKPDAEPAIEATNRKVTTNLDVEAKENKSVVDAMIELLLEGTNKADAHMYNVFGPQAEVLEKKLAEELNRRGYHNYKIQKLDSDVLKQSYSNNVNPPNPAVTQNKNDDGEPYQPHRPGF